ASELIWGTLFLLVILFLSRGLLPIAGEKLTAWRARRHRRLAGEGPPPGPAPAHGVAATAESVPAGAPRPGAAEAGGGPRGPRPGGRELTRAAAGGGGGLPEERGEAGGQGPVHGAVGGDRHAVRRRRHAERAGAAERPGPAHRRPGDRRHLLRRGDERVLGAVRRGTAPAGGGGRGVLPGEVPGARAHRPSLRRRDHRADPARGAGGRGAPRGGPPPAPPAPRPGPVPGVSRTVGQHSPPG